MSYKYGINTLTRMVHGIPPLYNVDSLHVQTHDNFNNKTSNITSGLKTAKFEKEKYYQPIVETKAKLDQRCSLVYRPKRLYREPFSTLCGQKFGLCPFPC